MVEQEDGGGETMPDPEVRCPKCGLLNRVWEGHADGASSEDLVVCGNCGGRISIAFVTVALERAHLEDKEVRFKPPPHLNAEPHQKVMAKLGEMTDAEVFQTSVDAGIHASSGSLTKQYGGEMEDRGEPVVEILNLYGKRVNPRISAAIGQPTQVANESPSDRKRTQFLVLTIADPQEDRYIALKLSTFRKIVKWVDSKGMLESRHMTDQERNIIDRKLVRAVQRLRERDAKG